jgi:GTP:adenosylcobinamide-phosphate guanylyltransferase
MDVALKYVGPKALFSVSGITYDNSKEDKFIYLSILAELIEALDHEYVSDQRYIVETGNKPLDETILLDLIRKRPSNLDGQIEYWFNKTIKEVDDDIERARKNLILNSEERQILIKNLEILRPYRIQRSINKSIYYAGVKLLASIIKQSHLQYILTPMYPKFLHVLHSVQGALRAMHPPIDSTIDIHEEKGHLVIQLKIQGSR